MRHLLSFAAFFAFLILLVNTKTAGEGFPTLKTNTVEADTVIGTLLIGDELAGSAYRKRATAYFLVIGKDSSAFRCYVTESDKAQVGIDMRVENNSLSWKQRLAELSALLPDASRAYSFDSLKNIYIGRLIHTAELSSLITADYRKYFGKSNKIPAYPWVEKMMMRSKLTADLNMVFQPYKMAVESYQLEKVSFSGTGQGKELDAMTWVRMKKLITNY